MRGRKPTPIEQRIKQGNPHHRPLPQPVLVGGRPELAELAEPPADIPADGKRFWREHMVRLVEAGIVDRVDIGSLESLCTAYARMCQIRRMIAKAGLLTTAGNGSVRPHPLFGMEMRAASLYNQLAEQYGLTPVSRARLGLAEVSRRTLSYELEERLGPRTLVPIDGTVVEE